MHVIKVLACGGKAVACSGGPVPQRSQFKIVRAVRDGWRRDGRLLLDEVDALLWKDLLASVE